MNRFALVFLLSLFMFSGASRADSITAVTDRISLNANDSVDWGLFGSPYTDVISGSAVQSQNGIGITVTQPFYSLQVRQQDAPGTNLGFYGDFSAGETLLTNWNSPFPVTIAFSQPVFAAGLQIEPAQVQDLPAPFTVYVTAYDGTVALGTFSTTGIKSNDVDGSAPFLGVQSDTADITSLTYRVVTQTNGPVEGDIGMNYMSMRDSAPVPEPSTLALMIVGFAALAAIGLGDRDERRRSGHSLLL